MTISKQTAWGKNEKQQKIEKLGSEAPLKKLTLPTELCEVIFRSVEAFLTLSS